MGAHTTYQVSKSVSDSFLKDAVHMQESVNVVNDSVDTPDGLFAEFIDFNAEHATNDELESLLSALKIPFIKSNESAIDIDASTEIHTEIHFYDDEGKLELFSFSGDEGQQVLLNEVHRAYQNGDDNFFAEVERLFNKEKDAYQRVEHFTLSSEQALANLIVNDPDLNIDNVEGVYASLIDADKALDVTMDVEINGESQSLSSLLQFDITSNSDIGQAVVDYFYEKNVDVDLLAESLDVTIGRTTQSPR
jgi:arsenate reductase-like glutaredoxin family protein